MIRKIFDREPKIENSAYIAPSADIIGDVIISEDVSIWFNVTIRGDNQSIIIGKGTNIQDNSVIHNDKEHILKIGEGVTIGHSVIVHNKEIGDNTLIGMGSSLLNGAVIGKNSIIGANSLITEGTIVGDGQLWFGNPAKYRRDLTKEEIMSIKENAEHYIVLGKEYKR